MPQFLRMSLVDGLAFNPNNNLGGSGAHYKFSKFKKSKINQGLGVIEFLFKFFNFSLIFLLFCRKISISSKKFKKMEIMLLLNYPVLIYFN